MYQVFCSKVLLFSTSPIKPGSLLGLTASAAGLFSATEFTRAIARSGHASGISSAAPPRTTDGPCPFTPLTFVLGAGSEELDEAAGFAWKAKARALGRRSLTVRRSVTR